MMKNIGKPYAGKPHVRFDEGVGKAISLPALLYRLCEKQNIMYYRTSYRTSYWTSCRTGYQAVTDQATGQVTDQATGQARGFTTNFTTNLLYQSI